MKVLLQNTSATTDNDQIFYHGLSQILEKEKEVFHSELLMLHQGTQLHSQTSELNPAVIKQIC